MNEYKLCLICNQPLPEGLANLAVRQIERKICGNQPCRKAYDVKFGLVCCDQATYTNCVCARSYTCPVHGDTHVGTHD